MSTSLKHILRIGDTDTNLGAGATKLKNKQIGITTDTDQFVYMDSKGVYHRCANEGGTTVQDYITLTALLPASYPVAVAGKALIFYGSDGQLRVQHPTGSPEIIVTTPPGSDGL